MKATYQTVPFHKVIAIFFLPAIILFSTFHPVGLSAARAQQGGAESLSGWFMILRGDSQDGGVTEIHRLTTDDGQSIALLLDERVTEPVGGLLALDGRKITVNGNWTVTSGDQGDDQTFQVASIAPLQEADFASTAVTGRQKWVSLLCKFQDKSAEPRDLAYFQNMYKASYPGLDHYWRELSYNLLNTVGSTASGWYTLPHPRSYYMSGARFNLDKAAADCTGAANANINFAAYAGVNLMFNAQLDGFAWGGGSYLSLDGVTKVWKMTWEPPWGYANVAVLIHEMGHALGLPHSSGGYGQTFDNEWDVMSDTWTGCRNREGSDPVYGCLGQHTIAYHKDRLGWIPAAQKMSLGAGTAKTVQLEQLSLPQTSNLKMLKIPIAGSKTHFYTVEGRRLTGYDTQLAGNAVIIHEVKTTRSESPAHVIDIDKNGVTGDPGAMWTTGEIFRDATSKITVAVLARTASGFRVHATSGLNVYYITGSIGVSNVTIKYTGGSTKTDATGRYIFPVSAGWSGTVRPVKAGYTFTPASRTFSNVTADKKKQNFSFTSAFVISGTTGVAGTTLSYTTTAPKKVTSQLNGNYSLRARGGWDGVVVPSHACYSFSPANRAYNNLAGNQPAQNYSPTFNSDSGCADLYARIGGANRARLGLRPGTSTRVSFANLSSGPVKIFSKNAAPLVVSERLIYKANNVPTSLSEMLGLPHNQVDKIYWLPWYNNVDLNTQLLIANVSGSAATVHVTIGGTPVAGSPFTIPAGASLSKSFAGIDNGPVKIQSNVNIVAAQRVIYSGPGGVATSFSEMMAMPAGQLDSIYWLPWYNNKDLDTELRIANVSDTPATVQIYIGGAPMDGGSFTIQPGASLQKSYPSIDMGPVKIESDVKIVATQRVIYRVNGAAASFSEMMALPNIHTNTIFWLPWYDNKNLDSQLRFTNVSSTPATVHVSIGGTPVSGSPFTLGPGASLRKSFLGIDKGPVKIESDVNIIASERLIYKVNGVGVSFSEMMAMSNGFLDSIYWLPWYNNKNLDAQLRFTTP